MGGAVNGTAYHPVLLRPPRLWDWGAAILCGGVAHCAALAGVVLALSFGDYSAETLPAGGTIAPGPHPLMLVVIGPLVETLVLFLPVLALLRQMRPWPPWAMHGVSLLLPGIIGYLCHGASPVAAGPTAGFIVLGAYMGILARRNLGTTWVWALLSLSHGVWNSLSIGVAAIRAAT